MKRRKIDPETKMAAVLEGFRVESSVADICRKFQISEILYCRWRDKFLAWIIPQELMEIYITI
jgi:transposase-like protein